MNGVKLPRSQGELIRIVRAEKTQSVFAKELGVDRSCLSRYESEALGAPTNVINFCLKALAERAQAETTEPPIARAMGHVRLALAELEQAAVQGGAASP